MDCVYLVGLELSSLNVHVAGGGDEEFALSIFLGIRCCCVFLFFEVPQAQ